MFISNVVDTSADAIEISVSSCFLNRRSFNKVFYFVLNISDCWATRTLVIQDGSSTACLQLTTMVKISLMSNITPLCIAVGNRHWTRNTTRRWHLSRNFELFVFHIHLVQNSKAAWQMSDVLDVINSILEISKSHRFMSDV